MAHRDRRDQWRCGASAAFGFLLATSCWRTIPECALSRGIAHGKCWISQSRSTQRRNASAARQFHEGLGVADLPANAETAGKIAMTNVLMNSVAQGHVVPPALDPQIRWVANAVAPNAVRLHLYVFRRNAWAPLSGPPSPSIHTTARARLRSSASKSRSSPRARILGGDQIFLQDGEKAAARRRTITRGTSRSMWCAATRVWLRRRGACRTTTLVHLPAGTVHWFRFGKGGGQMISITSREAASASSSTLTAKFRPHRLTSSDS